MRTEPRTRWFESPAVYPATFELSYKNECSCVTRFADMSAAARLDKWHWRSVRSAEWSFVARLHPVARSISTRFNFAGLGYRSSPCGFFFFFWHAPLRVHSAKYTAESAAWTIVSHISWFIQGEVIGFQIVEAVIVVVVVVDLYSTSFSASNALLIPIALH